MATLPTLTIGAHTVPYPVVQGGMGIRISGANLAAAVANAGGVGVISAVGLGMNSPYFNIDEKNPKKRQADFFEANRLALIDELQLARALSPQGVIGVNIMVAARDYETLVHTAIDHGANVIVSGAGLPWGCPPSRPSTQRWPWCRLSPACGRPRLFAKSGSASSTDCPMPLW